MPSFLDHVEDLLSVLRWVLGETGTPPLLVGHSLGGSVSLVASARQPDAVAGLLVFEAPLLWEPWWPRPQDEPTTLSPTELEDSAERFMRRIVGDAIWEALPERTKEQRRAEGPVLEAELRTARMMRPPDLSLISAPVIVATGSEVPDQRRRAIASILAAIPSAESAVLTGAPHNAHTARPEGFAGLIEALGRRVDEFG